MTQGINLSKSGWENPEGHQPRERDYVPPPTPACEAAGPDGWVCDLVSNHGGEWHKAIDGPEWPRRGPLPAGAPAPSDQVFYDTSNMEPNTLVLAGELGEIHKLAIEALESVAPAAWPLALNKIVEMTRGY